MREVVFGYGPQGFGSYQIELEPGRIEWQPSNAVPQLFLAPGFVDQHIHGSFGFDFMEASTGEINHWADKLAELGYECFLPTTITASPHEIQQVINRLPDHPLIGGFHLEGPFLSPSFPGAQPPSFIQSVPDGPSEWDPILEDPRLKVVTVAPELPGGVGLIKRLASRGVKVGMGHTNAVYAEAKQGYEAGATHSTHTFNAMRPLHHREAGMVGFCLNQPQFGCELIYDRIHVCQEAASILVRCKGEDAILAVSDGTKASGMEPGLEFKMWGLDVVTGVKEVRLKSGALAGSAITLLDAFQNLASDFGPEAAMKATSLNPRKNIGFSGEPRVQVLFDKGLNLLDVFRVG